MAEVYRIAGIVAAKIGGESPLMDAVAATLAANARAAAAQHNDSGQFADSIRVRNVPGKRGVRDRVVEATDPLGAIKEFGHTAPNGRRVPGQHSMQKAVLAMPEVQD